jgi:Tfp pilus assembly PilM family ATPase
MLLGTVPTGKILYGSDEASEPEVFWLSARIAREALERVLARAVERDYLTAQQGVEIGRGVLAGNTARLHGIG